MTSVGRRVRKVTLTEIEDGKEWNWPDPGNLEEECDDGCEMSTDDMFKQFDDMVQDWKIKLELIVADGLKKMKKNGKEKKSMIKYIPGEAGNKRSDVIMPAKTAILNDYKAEMNQVLKTTQKRLTRLNQDKIHETCQLVGSVSKADAGKPSTIISKTKRSNFVDLKVLMRELDSLYSIYNSKIIQKVPVYENLLSMEKNRNSLFGWWKPICTLMRMIDYPMRTPLTIEESEQDILDILKDFTVDQKSRKNIVSEWERKSIKKDLMQLKMKSTPKTRAGSSMRKMMERKEKKKFVLKEFESNGEKHFLVVKKQCKEAEDAEDIFADWKNNLAKNKAKKPRTRKISHRAERKEMIKSVISEPSAPKSYAQAVMKNLKKTEAPAVEDVFECFAGYVEELNDLLVEPTTPRKDLDMVDIFHPFRHNFHIPEDRLSEADILSTTTCIPSLVNFECGKPTIKAMPIKSPHFKAKSLDYRKSIKEPTKAFRSKKAALSKKIEKKDPSTFAWQSLLTSTKELPKKKTAPKLKIEYTSESFFEDWITNLDEPVLTVSPKLPLKQNPKTPQVSPKVSKKKVVCDYTCESFFSDWLHNLKEPEVRPRKLEVITEMDQEFEDFKDNRRRDFARGVKIKDKKRSQAERRSTGKRIK